LVDAAPPAAPGNRSVRQPLVAWAVGAAVVTVTYAVVELAAAELAADLAAVEAAAVGRINREAGGERARHITVTTGQEGTYLAKQAEAERFLAGVPGPHPYLEAEAAATGAAVAAVAAVVAETAAQWTALNAAIEGARRGALVAVERAVAIGDRAAVEAVFPIAWPGLAG